MSLAMAAMADGSCAAMSAAIRAVPAESAASNARPFGSNHSERTISADLSAKVALFEDP